MIIAPIHVTQCPIYKALLTLGLIKKNLENASALLSGIMDQEKPPFEEVKLITFLLVI